MIGEAFFRQSGYAMKMRFKVLPLLLLLTLPAVGQAQFQFVINNGAITITRYTGTGGPVTIPSTTNGLPVTSIGDYAFLLRSSVTSITIPDSVTNIGTSAFYWCSGLTSVTIGTNVTSVGSYAFTDCTSLTAIAIPNSVTNIGSLTFDGCSSLTNVTLGNHLTSIGSSAFNSCTSLTAIAIPNSVVNIGSIAFNGCSSLATIAVDSLNSVFSSVDGVLFDKSQATFIECPASRAGAYAIPTNVTSLGSFAFYFCTKLTGITFPNSVTNIPILNGCSSLTTISVDTLNSAYSSADGVLFDKSQATLLQCPAARVGDYAISNVVTRIGSYAFNGCTLLTSVTIPNSVTNIGTFAFSSCKTLTSVIIPDSVTSVGTAAFCACSNLMTISVGALNPAYSSADGVLFDKSQATLLQCPAGKAGACAISNIVTSIGSYAFNGCNRLTSVTIPNSVTNIGTYAFSYCASLSSVTIPGSATNIGLDAFLFCPRLTDVFFSGNAPTTADSSMFFGDNNATVYYLPGRTNWTNPWQGRPTMLWKPQMQTSGSDFGVRTNHFGFNITWASGMAVVVEACTNLAHPIWSPVRTNTLTSGSSYFSDPQWTNYPVRLYRIRWP
jgi:hypothetical protein